VNICESVLSLKAYQGGKPISELQRELGLDEVVKLASNEKISTFSTFLAICTKALCTCACC
jgi:hypothetical protein